MSNANAEGGETSNAGGHVIAIASSSSGVEAVTSVSSVVTKSDDNNDSKDKSKTSENGSETTPKVVSRPPYIPPHLMGRDLNDPAQDMVGTGRRVQKPRLGVKVPYRNLTSQIVSQDEIAQEILERSLRKYSYSEVPEGGDVFFAMKLTHRLANKITPTAADSSAGDRVAGGSDGGGDASSAVSCSAANKSGNGVETPLKRNAIEMAAAAVAVVATAPSPSTSTTTITITSTAIPTVCEAAKENERRTEANMTKKNVASDKTAAKGGVDQCNEISKNDNTSVHFESKADQLYAEISSTLEEECKIIKPLKISASPGVNSCTKVVSSRLANGSISQSTTETELDNDTLLAILEGTSDVSDVSINTITSTPKIEPTPQQQQQPLLPPPPPPPPLLPTHQQQQRKKRIKPLLDPNVEKELALKQLMDFETKKTEDRLKKSAAKKLKLDEEMTTPVATQHLGGGVGITNNGNNNNNNNNNNTNKNKNSLNNANANNSCASSNGTSTSHSENNSEGVGVGVGVNVINNKSNGRSGDAVSKITVGTVQGCNVNVSSTGANSSRPEVESALSKCDAPAPAAKKTKKNTFSGGSIAPKRFPKKYQRIIKRQLRSSKMKAKTSSPDQQRRQQRQPHQPPPPPPQQKKLPEVPEVQIAIDRYIKTYASKRKQKPEAAAAAASAEAKSKVVACEANVEKKMDGQSEAKTDIATNDAPATKGSVQSDKDASRVRAAKDNDEDDTVGGGSSSRPTTGPVDDEIKENASPTTARPKANSKVMREINRLLGDEGAINMIYSIEQKRLPDSKRDTNILPSLRRKKKDLLLKTKLVKNAVLRLSMSPAQLSPGRVRRTSPEVGSSQTTAAAAAKIKSTMSPSRKASMESLDSNASEQSPSPKVRKVAAEASRIIRRHSSSSAYSSDEDENVVVAAAAELANAQTTGKNKTTADKNAVVSRVQPVAVDVAVIAAETESTAVVGDCTNANANETVDSSSVLNSGNNNENEICVIGGKIDENDEKSVVANDGQVATNSLVAAAAAATATTTTTVAAATSVANVTCSSKRKDPKEGSVGIAAKISNDSSTASSDSELVERLRLKEITLRKYDNLVQIILISSSCKMKNAINIQVFSELTSVLGELEKDESCRTVLVTSTGSCFCQGIDLQALIQADISERRKVVNEYVTALLNFTKCLSQFKKILIAGVHGSAVGLGVTLLPFFDMVFASDKATFYTPYVKLGQIPEAGATLTLPHLLGNAVTSELLFGSRMLTASEALQFGLVTRILWPDKFGEELLPIARSVASNSSQSMEATKYLLRHSMNEKLQQQLITEAKLLKEHWSSDECQRRFNDYLQQEALLQNK